MQTATKPAVVIQTSPRQYKVMRGEVVIAYISLTQDFQKQAESVDIGRFVTPQASSNRPSRRYAKAQEAASGWLIDERA